MTGKGPCSLLAVSALAAFALPAAAEQHTAPRYRVPGGGVDQIGEHDPTTGAFVPTQQCAWGTSASCTALPSSLKGVAATFSPNRFYVATAAEGGSDSNDCLSATVTSPHGPCLTIQHATNVALTYDTNSLWTYIDIGAGSFAGPTVSGAMRGAGGPAVSGTYLVLNGVAGSTNITNAIGTVADIAASDHATVVVQNVTLQVASGIDGLFSQNAAVLQVGNNVVFRGLGPNATAEHVEGEALIEHAKGLALRITGQFGQVFTAGITGYIEFDPGGGTIDLTGLTSFDNFVFIGDTSEIFFGRGWRFPNGSTATGRPYFVNRNGFVRNDTGSPLPGGTKGWVETGGRYTPTPTPSLTNFSEGLGAGGTAAFSGKAGSHGGRIVLTAGSASTRSSGTVRVIPAEYNLDTGNNPVPCIASLLSGSANWAVGATAQLTTNTADALTITWSNAGSALKAGSTYQINYVCVGD